MIEDQVRSAKATIAKEEEDFKTKKEHHLIRYDTRRSSNAQKEDEPAARSEADAPKAEAGDSESRESEPAKKESEQKPVHDHDPHDESGDVLVEADEDMVIY